VPDTARIHNTMIGTVFLATVIYLNYGEMNNIKDLQHEEAIKKLQELVDEIDICLFWTNLSTDEGSNARPMSTLNCDEHGYLWFFSARDSDKNAELMKDDKVRLIYSHPGRNSYLIVNGVACVSTDRHKIEELWTPVAKAWFKEGKNDPNISLIKVKAKTAYYWDAEGNRMINFLKMIASVATGQEPPETEEGQLSID